MTKEKRFNLSKALYKLIKNTVKRVYPPVSVEGAENIPDEPCIYIGNHSQAHGPIISQLYLPGNPITWCAGQMMKLKEVPAYTYRDFWGNKPFYIRWLFRIVSFLIAPISVLIFNNADVIAVHRDTRIISTFRNTTDALEHERNIVIFPECAEPHNNIVYDFQDGFVNAARYYYKSTKKAVPFVPMYVAPKLGKVYFGKPVRFDPNAVFNEEKKRICTELMDGVTAIAQSLPPHRVIPYVNISKKLYPTNVPTGEAECNNEKTNS